MPTIMPMLDYEAAEQAIEFLCRAFGFVETERIMNDDGTIGHSTLRLGDGAVALSTVWRAGGFSTPHDLGGVHGQVWCEVEDVDAHFAKAVAEGATILGPPEDIGVGFRAYRAIDPEGHRWFFGARIA